MQILPFACFMWLFYNVYTKEVLFFVSICMFHGAVLSMFIQKKYFFCFHLHVSWGCSIMFIQKKYFFCFHLHVSCGCCINIYTKEVPFFLASICMFHVAVLSKFIQKKYFFLLPFACFMGLFYQCLYKRSTFFASICMFHGAVLSMFIQKKYFFCFHLHVSWGCSINVYTKEVLFLLPFACFMGLFYQKKYVFYFQPEILMAHALFARYTVTLRTPITVGVCGTGMICLMFIASHSQVYAAVTRK